MTKTRYVGGNATYIVRGTTKEFANEIEINSNGRIEYNAPEYTYGDPEPRPVREDAEFDIDFSLDKDEKTVVPFGILDFKNNKENPFFSFKYTLRGNNVDSLSFKVTNENNEIIYQMGYLKPVIITAQKKPEILFKAKQPTEGPLTSKLWDYQKFFRPYFLEEPDYTKLGNYYLNWDGFDNNEIYDSTKFAGKKLKAQITAVKGDKVKTKEVEFEVSYKEVEWVDVKIDRKAKRIDVTLRVNFTDGGENGLTCQTINANMYGTPARTICDWDKIPSSVTNPSDPIIKSRTRSFLDLEKLAIQGLNYHWGRNRNHAEAKNININGNLFEVFVNSIVSNQKSIGVMKLIYNTNNDWIRSGNPGSIKDPMTAIGNIVSRQAISYNVGYIYEYFYINTWSYQQEVDEDEEFKFTSAHEIGHEILKKYGGTIYSYGHKESVNPVTQNMKNNASKYPSNGEIDIMPYYPSSPPPALYNRYVASDKDVKSLVWLSKLEIK